MAIMIILQDRADALTISLLLWQSQLSYPAFVMPMPSFVHPEMKERFLHLNVVNNTYLVISTDLSLLDRRLTSFYIINR